MSYNRRLGLEIYGNASGALRMYNQLLGGSQKLDRGLHSNQRSMSQLDQGMRALGTTARYAFVGGIVFGATQAIASLSAVQEKLGLIAAIGGSGFSKGNAPRELLMDIQKASIDTLTPVQEIEDAVVNLLSTVSNVPRNQVTPIVADIAKTAKLAQISAEDATKAFTTMNIAFARPNNARNIHAAGQEFFSLIQKAPGGAAAGGQIIQQLGPLSGLFGPLGHGTPEQMNALILGSLRFGGSPSTAIRGLQFLTQSVIQPQTKEAQETLASIGVTPAFVQKQGVYKSILKVLRHAQGLGVKGDPSKVAAIGDETLDQGDITGAGPDTLGISGAGSEFLRKALRRIHAVRVGAILSAQLEQHGKVESLDQDLKLMNEALTGTIDATTDVRKAWERYHQQAPLKEAGNAINNLTLAAVKALDPLTKPLAHGATFLGKQAVAHPRAVQTTEIALGALLGVRMASRFIPAVGALTGRLPRGLRGLLGGKGSLAGAALIAEEAPAVLAGSTASQAFGPLGTRANPMWVIISPISDLISMRKDQGTGGRGIPGAPIPVGRGIPGWVKGVGFTAGAIAADQASAAIARKITGDKEAKAFIPRLFDMSTYTRDVPRNAKNIFTLGGLIGGHKDPDVFHREQNWNKIRHQAAAARNAGMAVQGGLANLDFKGDGVIKLKVELTGDAARVIKAADTTAHVPVTLWTQTPPMHRGKPKTHRTGGR